MKVYVPIKEIVSATTLKEANDYLPESAKLKLIKSPKYTDITML